MAYLGYLTLQKSFHLWKKNKEEEDSQVLVAKAEVTVESYIKIKAPQMKASSRQVSATQQSWTLPLKSWFKVNVDATIKSKNQC